MTYPKPYEKGVLGVLLGQWQLELQSPLIIRNGQKAAFRQQQKSFAKGRGMHLDLDWDNAETRLATQPADKKEYSEIADFNHHFSVQDCKLQIEYSIPDSSIRGALRNAAIKRWVEWNERKAFSVPNKEDIQQTPLVELADNAKRALLESKNGWYDILSLFGCAFDLGLSDDHPLNWAGRMRLTTAICNDAEANLIDYMGKNFNANDGPQNILRQIAVRNPIDRTTMAAKDGGLHTWLEMSAGQSFHLDFEIINPRVKDIELLNLWIDEINEGYLRFGALTNQGRGRMAIAQENYELFVSKASALTQKLLSQNLPEPTKKDFSLQDIWMGVKLSLENLTARDYQGRRVLDLDDLLKLQGGSQDE